MKKIAMKASQKDWDSIKDRFKSSDILGVDLNPSPYFGYLINYYNSSNTFGIGHYNCENADEIHETFNAKIFLEACGIEFDEYKITKETILSLHRHGNDLTKSQLNDLFPDCFKKELIVVDGYYKHKNGQHPKWFCHIDVNTGEYYGHNNTEWMTGGKNGFGDMIGYIKDNCEPMTPKEVEEALIKEWEKLGGKVGVQFKTPINQFNGVDNGKYNFVKADNCLYSDGCAVFNKGKFATIINKKKMTISEIEEKLGHGVEVVMDFNVKGTI